MAEEDDLRAKIALYEQNGAAKAAYSIIADPKDKSFERLKVAWGEMASLGEAYKTLAESAGITGDENKDVVKKPFNDRIAESRV